MCDIERERRAKRGASAKIVLATGLSAISDPSYKKCRQNTPKTIYPTDLIFFSRSQPAYRITRTHTYSWHILLFVSDAKSCMACMCGIVRERRAKRGASAKNFFSRYRACNAKPAYRTTRTHTYSWHILLFVSDAKSCMACMCGIVRKR